MIFFSKLILFLTQFFSGNWKGNKWPLLLSTRLHFCVFILSKISPFPNVPLMDFLIRVKWCLRNYISQWWQYGSDRTIEQYLIVLEPWTHLEWPVFSKSLFQSWCPFWIFVVCVLGCCGLGPGKSCCPSAPRVLGRCLNELVPCCGSCWAQQHIGTVLWYLSVQALVLFLSSVSTHGLSGGQLSDCYSLCKLLSRSQIPLQLGI